MAPLDPERWEHSYIHSSEQYTRQRPDTTSYVEYLLTPVQPHTVSLLAGAPLLWQCTWSDCVYKYDGGSTVYEALRIASCASKLCDTSISRARPEVYAAVSWGPDRKQTRRTEAQAIMLQAGSR